MKARIASFFILASLSFAASAACYTVFDGAQKIVYRGNGAPINLERPLSDATREKFGVGAVMVFDPSDDVCTSVDQGRAADSSVDKLTNQLARDNDTVLRAREGGDLGTSGVSTGGVGPWQVYTGPRGGQFRYSSSGSKMYQTRR